MYVARRGSRFIPLGSDAHLSSTSTTWCHRYEERRPTAPFYIRKGARIGAIRGSSRSAVMPSPLSWCAHALMRAPQYPRGTSTTVSTRFIPLGSDAILLFEGKRFNPFLVRPRFIPLGCASRNAAEQGKYTPSWRRQRCLTACSADCSRSLFGRNSGGWTEGHPLRSSRIILTTIQKRIWYPNCMFDEIIQLCSM